ncbi:fungal-specific transcription factor domain-containing protein [Penicillium concentricum]|uniref:Fungal-specific transcription factor domain-containing protein n=1 Tax=Penicillium concentricum TaxID=293559 RepID=A0A9W9SU94_9EURO|nr:fungal-specific transcription factor domain-containing protein [Penicillium concentricum]KAJ5382633.1 fungal-specific transcription factor domain-containing protein [Penicillium concentricum]
MPSVQGPRTKVTLACDACRKRRIKCSDTFPCSSCVETGTNCVFDDKYRGRRGPRARRPPKRVIHDLAPATTGTAIPILHKTTDPSRNAPEGPERWFDVRSATPATESVTVIQPPSNSDTDEEDASSSRFLGASKWTAGLEGLLSGDQSITNDPTLDINLMSHLLEIFYSHTSALIKQILPAFQLFEALADGTAFCGLILAACASSVRFSTHRSARPSTGEDPGIAARLAKLARASIDIYSYDMLPHLDQIRTICILVEALKVPDAKVVENLRFVFMVVAAVSKFYTQGKSWLNTMFRVYDVNTPLTRVSGSLEGAFDGYFSRFKELCEPSCVPLDPDQPLGDDIDNGSRPWSQVPSQNALDQPAQGSSWAADYAGHLSEYISDEGAEQGPYSSTDRQEVTRLAYSGQPGSTSNEVDQDYGNRGIGIEHGRGGSSGQQLTTERWPLTGVDAALLLGMEDGYGARFESSALAPIFQSSPDLTTSPFTGIENITRVTLAINYHGNDYHHLVPMAMSDPALLNVALAVAASHHSRWQHTADETSQKYLRASCKALKQRFTNPTLINDPETLASMLLLTTYEVFAGSSRWKNHHDAIRSWIRSRGDCAGLDPFLKNWVCLLDTQSSLNLGTATMPELDSWMDATTDQRETVDTLFGCSAKLPKLMSAASRLYVESKDPEIAIDEIRRKADILQDQIHATKIAPDTFPMIGLSCHSTVEAFSTTIGMDEDELRRRAVATAEIFRHASHIFVHRITHGPEETLPSEMRESLESAMQLLPLVPDALGPGANLGWCLVVLGAELDAVDQREYITSRWVGLHLLGIYNTKNGQKLLDEVWSHADLVRRGYATSERWQDTMLRIGQAQILV